MLNEESQLHYASPEELELKALMQTAALMTDLDNFTQQALSVFARIAGLPWTALYIADSRLLAPIYYQYGLPYGIALYMERSCAIEFNSFLNYVDLQYSIPAVTVPQTSGKIHYYPLLCQGTLTGLLQMGAYVNVTNQRLCEKFLVLISSIINRLLDSMKT